MPLTLVALGPGNINGYDSDNRGAEHFDRGVSKSFTLAILNHLQTRALMHLSHISSCGVFYPSAQVFF